MVRVLVTAGPTREYLDDVRYLANGSKGIMGHAVAAAAQDRGADVVLVQGPVECVPPAGVELVPVVSARDMDAACAARWPQCDIAIGVAAVADYRPAVKRAGKPPKGGPNATLELVRNPDVIAGLGHAKRPQQVVVGFALEPFAAGGGVEAARERAAAKLAAKRLDLVVLNDAVAMGADTARAILVEADTDDHDLGEQPKTKIAEALVERALELWRARTEEVRS